MWELFLLQLRPQLNPLPPCLRFSLYASDAKWDLFSVALQGNLSPCEVGRFVIIIIMFSFYLAWYVFMCASVGIHTVMHMWKSEDHFWVHLHVPSSERLGLSLLFTASFLSFWEILLSLSLHSYYIITEANIFNWIGSSELRYPELCGKHLSMDLYPSPSGSV